MIPTFLRPEVVPYASVEIVAAPPAVAYLLHVRHPSGIAQTLSFTSDFSRSLVLLTLVRQPVALKVEDVPAVAS